MLTLISYLLTPIAALAQGAIELNTSFPGSETTYSSIAQYFNDFFPFLTGLILSFAVISVMIEGIRWLTAGDSNRINQAKENIKTTLIGIVIVILTYTILAIINPDLTVLKDLDLGEKIKGEEFDSAGAQACGWGAIQRSHEGIPIKSKCSCGLIFAEPGQFCCYDENGIPSIEEEGCTGRFLCEATQSRKWESCRNYPTLESCTVNACGVNYGPLKATNTLCTWSSTKGCVPSPPQGISPYFKPLGSIDAISADDYHSQGIVFIQDDIWRLANEFCSYRGDCDDCWECSNLVDAEALCDCEDGKPELVL